jgi:hypothetical protein
VYLDGTTIVTDILNYYYTQTGDPTIAGSKLANQLTVKNGVRVDYTEDLTAGVTPITLNSVAGRFVIPAGSNARVLLCDKLRATSIVEMFIEGTMDATAQRVQVNAKIDGVCTATLNAAATANVTIVYNIVNVY